LEWSQHNVYAVTLPAESLFAKKKSIGVKSNVPDFAIKVVKDNATFKRECAVLVATRQSFFMGASSKGCSVSVLPAAFSGIVSEHSCTQSSWQWWSEGVKSITGGVIFMRLGEGLPKTLDDALRTRIINDCIPELRSIHELGYVHTDLRLPNILKFEEKYMPIDFGEAVEIGTDVNLSEFSEGRKKCLIYSPLDSTIKWNAEHDIEMLFRAVYSCPADIVEDAASHATSVSVSAGGNREQKRVVAARGRKKRKLR
jgi:tRNA A-37 threonylcarbamoyl transferase component Bud32